MGVSKIVADTRRIFYLSQGTFLFEGLCLRAKLSIFQYTCMQNHHFRTVHKQRKWLLSCTSAQNDGPSAQNDGPSARNNGPSAQNNDPSAQNGERIRISRAFVEKIWFDK